MVKYKGVYEWELKNADTGEIEGSGKQWNIISDRFLELLMWGSSNTQIDNLYRNGLAVQLSSSIPTPGLDYRVSGRSNSFTILATGSIVQYNIDPVNLSKYTSHNFPPPGTTARTINVIGVKLYSTTYETAKPNFASFIQLSTPITQNTNQYLYVKYTVFLSADLISGYNTPNSKYISYGINTSLFTDIMQWIGWPYTSNESNAKSVRFTYLLPPSDINKVHRNVPAIYATDGNTTLTNTGCKFGLTYGRSFTEAQMVGPIGSLVYGMNTESDAGSHKGYLYSTFGYSPINSVTPSVSRVFVHPAGREDQLFSDPSYPASSEGTVTISGTPTNRYPVIGRIRVTKTGDASDLVDETVSYTAVNVGGNSITVTQDIATGDMYRLTTTGTLPSPLVAGTDYYIIRVDAVTIRLATTYDFAIAGTAIDITDQGSGNHTFIRQNTGEYKLENSLWSVSANTNNMINLSMAIDFDGNVMPQNLDSTSTYYTNYADGDYVANGDVSVNAYPNEFYPGVTSPMLRGGLYRNGYVYTVQQSRKGLINNVCRWLFYSIETSEPLCKFGDGTTKVQGVLDGGPDTMYIYTNQGIYKYTFSTPTVAPVLLTITGMVDSNTTDACIDPITGYMWTGHTTGLSRVDLNTLTATQYIRGTGQALDGGLTTYEANVIPGQLDAYNGRVLIGGRGSYVSKDYSIAWVLDDGVGWYRVRGTGECYSCCLRKGTNQVVYLLNTYIVTVSVTVTGKGVGSVSDVAGSAYIFPGDYQDNTHPEGSIYSHLAQIYDNKFIYFYASRNTSGILATYSVESPTIQIRQIYSLANPLYSPFGFSHMLSAFRRNALYVNGEDAPPIYLWCRCLITTYFTYNPAIYGWDGSNWVINHSGSRKIPKTATHTLLNGLSVDFNNRTGGVWDKQFVSGDHFNFVHGPTFIKDNLQIVNFRCRRYNCEAHVVADYAVTIPASTPYEITIPEASGGSDPDPDFRDMDTVDGLATIVKEGATVYTQYTGTGSIPAGNYKATTLGVFSFSSLDAGKNLTITYTYTRFTS